MKILISPSLAVIGLLFSMTSLSAQENLYSTLSLDEAIHRALDSNFGIRTAHLRTEAAATTNSWGAAGALPARRDAGEHGTGGAGGGSGLGRGGSP